MLLTLIKWYNRYIPIRFGQTRLQKIAISDIENLTAVSKYGTEFELEFPKDKSWEKIFFWGTYETGTSDYLLEIINEVDVFIDIGANIGWYSVLIGKSSAKCKCYSFEPHPQVYRSLTRHIHINKVTDKVIPINSGLGRKQEKKVLYTFRDYGHGHSSLSDLGSSDYETSQVTIITLDSFILEYNVNGIKIIKLDVEGAELDVLNGATNLLKSNEPPVWIIEMNEETADNFRHKPVDLLEYIQGRVPSVFYTIKGAWGGIREMKNLYDFSHGDNVIVVPAIYENIISKTSRLASNREY